jgi:hypothetical protein
MDIINVGFLRWIWTNRAYPSSFPLDCSLPLSFCFVFVFQDRVSLCNSPDCSGTLLVDQASLKLTDLPASASWVLRLRCMPPHPASYLPLIQLGFYGVVHLVFFFFIYFFWVIGSLPQAIPFGSPICVERVSDCRWTRSQRELTDRHKRVCWIWM